MNRIFDISKLAGYTIHEPIDPTLYPEIPGLEGPFRTRSGKIVYYDPRGQVDASQSPGMYYDKDADRYLSYDEYEALNQPRPQTPRFFR